LLLLKIENKELSKIDDLLALPSKNRNLTKKITAEFTSQDHANKFNTYLQSYRDIYDKKSPSTIFLVSSGPSIQSATQVTLGAPDLA
jgi:hypothetical protein